VPSQINIGLGFNSLEKNSRPNISGVHFGCIWDNWVGYVDRDGVRGCLGRAESGRFFEIETGFRGRFRGVEPRRERGWGWLSRARCRSPGNSGILCSGAVFNR
jgi:hypothetical protein